MNPNKKIVLVAGYHYIEIAIFSDALFRGRVYDSSNERVKVYTSPMYTSFPEAVAVCLDAVKTIVERTILKGGLS